MADIEEKKNVPERIDQKTKDWRYEPEEISNFIFDKNNQKDNINDLCNYLDKVIDPRNSEEKYVRDNLMTDLITFFKYTGETQKMFKDIENKVKNNEKLTKDEISLIYLKAMIFGEDTKVHSIALGQIDFRERFKHSKHPFNPNESINKICDGDFLEYIRLTYLNENYNPEPYSPSSNKKNTMKENRKYIEDPVKYEKEREIERKKKEYESLPNIPPIEKEEDVRWYFNKIILRAEGNGYLSNIEHVSKLKYQDIEDDKEFDDYVKYDKFLYAFQKYCEAINNKHEEIILNAGYKDTEEFTKETEQIKKILDDIEKKYPTLNEVMERLEPYFESINKIQNKYFGGKNNNEIEKGQQDFINFLDYEKEKRNEYGITDQTGEILNKTPESKEEMEDYFKSLIDVFSYQSDLNTKKQEYGTDIDNYYGYYYEINELKNQYSDSDFEIMAKYNFDLQSGLNESILKKFNTYNKLLSEDKTLSYNLNNIGMISNVLNNPTSEHFRLEGVKKTETEKKERQEKIDGIRESIKKYAPGVYFNLTSLAGFWNGLVDATVGVGSSLGVLLTTTKRGNFLLNTTPIGLYCWIKWGSFIDLADYGEGQYLYTLRHKEKFDDYLKIPQSTSQKQPVYSFDKKLGKSSFNFSLDNTVSTVSSSVAQMIVLIYGGGGIAKGIGKTGLNISSKAASRIGLFSYGLISQVGQSYIEGKEAGLDGSGAFAYAMIFAGVQAGLELVSPNDILLGKGTGLGKELIRGLCNSNEGKRLVGRYFLKSVGREILEENLQEGLQLAAGNLVNQIVNGVGDKNFEVDWSRKNFLSTAIITTLTTGITTGFSAGKQGLQILNSSQPQLMARISTDTELYEEVMDVLDKTIEGKFNIPNVDTENLKLLKTTLSNLNILLNVQEDQGKKEDTKQKKKNRDNSYFEGQPHEFNIENMQEITIENSQYMDNLLETVNKGNLNQQLNELRKRISELYTKVTGEELELNDEQLLSILDAHEQDGVLGQLSKPEIARKVRILTETIKNDRIRRFLFEFGFCGSQENLNIGNTTESLYKTLMNEKISSIEDFNKIFNSIKPENENQRICLEACKEKFQKAFNAKNELMEQMKGKSIKERTKLITKFLEQYQLSINESKTEKTKWKRAFSNDQKVLFVKAYNSLIYTPLGLPYIDAGITLGGQNTPGIETSKINENSIMMSIALSEIVETTDEGKINKIINEIKQEIEQQYKNKTGKDLNLTIEQVWSILEAHSEKGILGQLQDNDITKRVKDLSLTITDPELRRFLIEYGFCAETDVKINENFSDKHDNPANTDLTNIEFNNENISEPTGENLKEIGNNLSKLQLVPGEITEAMILGEIDRISDPAEKAMAWNLWVSLNEKLSEIDARVSMEDRAFILSQSLKYLADYRISNPKTSPKKLFDLLSSNQNKILHQQMWDLNTNTSSDHGIKHILRGNMTLAEVLFDIMETKPENISEEEWKKGEENRARLRVLVRQAIIDHDLGYTNPANRLFDKNSFDKGYEMVSDHPLWSTVYIIEHSDFYKDFFGPEGYEILVKSIPGHSNAQTESLYKALNGTANDLETVWGILSCVDCTGSPGDYKIAFMFAQKDMIGGLFKAYRALKTGNIELTVQSLNSLKNIVESMPEGSLKEAWKQGVDAFLLDVNGKMDAELVKGFENSRTKKILAQLMETVSNTGKEFNLSELGSILENFCTDKKIKYSKDGKGRIHFEGDQNIGIEIVEIKDNEGTHQGLKIHGQNGGEFIIKFDENLHGRLNNSAEIATDIETIIDEAIYKGKYEKLKGMFNFKMGKFLGAYGIQTSIDETTGIPVCGKSNEGGFAIQFELAGDSFNYLAKQFDVKTALKSLTGVSEDLIIGFEDSFAESFIIELIKTVSDNGNIKGKNFDLSKLGSILEKFCTDKKIKYSKDGNGRIYFEGEKNIGIEINGNEGLKIHGQNGVEITLKFDGKPYVGLNSSIDETNKIETKIDNAISKLEINEGQSLNAIQKQISRFIMDLVENLNNEYGTAIGWNQEFLDKISDNIIQLINENATSEEIKQKISEIKYAYHTNMNIVGTSTNPVNNK